MSKVSKTESQVTKREEVDLSDNFFSRIDSIAAETQMKIAELMQEVETVMVGLRKDKDEKPISLDFRNVRCASRGMRVPYRTLRDAFFPNRSGV